jgi:hypothetical protein
VITLAQLLLPFEHSLILIQGGIFMTTTEEARSCPLCGKGSTPALDMATDQPGKVVHEECYFNRLLGKDYTALPLPFLPMT